MPFTKKEQKKWIIGYSLKYCYEREELRVLKWNLTGSVQVPPGKDCSIWDLRKSWSEADEEAGGLCVQRPWGSPTSVHSKSLVGCLCPCGETA